MTDLDPKIWNNKTLGSASKLPFLDEIEAQAAENRAARAEGREPAVVVHKDNYPKLIPSETVPSGISDVKVVHPSSLDEVVSEDSDDSKSVELEPKPESEPVVAGASDEDMSDFLKSIGIKNDDPLNED